MARASGRTPPSRRTKGEGTRTSRGGASNPRPAVCAGPSASKPRGLLQLKGCALSRPFFLPPSQVDTRPLRTSGPRWMLLRRWQESSLVRNDDLDDRLFAGVIIDLEGIDDKQSGTSRKLPPMPPAGGLRPSRGADQTPSTGRCYTCQPGRPLSPLGRNPLSSAPPSPAGLFFVAPSFALIGDKAQRRDVATGDSRDHRPLPARVPGQDG